MIDNSNEAIKSDQRQESRQKFYGTRFVGDITWNERKRQSRKSLGLHELLDTNWKKPNDYQDLAIKAKKQSSQLKDSIHLSVEKIAPAQIYTQLVFQLGLKTESKQVKQLTPDGRKKIREKRIDPESWKLAQLFIAHREEIRLQRDTQNSQLNQPEIAGTPPPILFSKEIGGVVPSQTHIGNRLEGNKTSKKLSNQKPVETATNNIVKSYNFKEQNTTINPLDTKEEIARLADMLTQIENAEELEELQKVPEFTRSRLNRACHLLSQEQQRLMRQWAIENREGKSTA